VIVAAAGYDHAIRRRVYDLLTAAFRRAGARTRRDPSVRATQLNVVRRVRFPCPTYCQATMGKAHE
jgi:hypothetical protein